MPLVTNADISRHYGVSRKTVTTWDQDGKLPPPRSKNKRGNPLYELEEVERALSESLSRAPVSAGIPEEMVTPEPTPEPTHREQKVASPEQPEQDEPAAPSARTKMTLLQAQTARANIDAHLKHTQLQRLQGKLVLKDRINAAVFRLARNARDAWLSWPARVDGLITAEVNSFIAQHGTMTQRQMHLILDRHVRQHLAELGKLDPETFDLLETEAA